MTKLKEYDLELNPTTIIKGKGLCKALTEGHANEYCVWEDEVELIFIDVCPIFTTPKCW